MRPALTFATKTSERTRASLALDGEVLVLQLLALERSLRVWLYIRQELVLSFLRVISITELLGEFDDVRLCCLTKNARHGEHLFVLGVVDDAQQAHLHILVAVPIWGR